METPKRSAHQIWREAKENNLTKEETKKLLVKEGVIVKKSDHNTLYRKVAVSERFPQFAQRVIALVLEQNDLGLSKFLWNVSYSDITKSFKMDGNTVQIEYWLEEIPDNTAQLQTDKAELLEALEKLRNHYGLFPENRIEIESLIQKMKKCQENTPR